MRKIAAITMVCAMASSAFAQQQNASSGNCERADRLVCSSGNASSIIGAQGNVLVSTTAGYTPAAVGALIGPGGSVLSRDGSAQIRLSEACIASIGPNTRAVISNAAGKTCVQLEAAVPDNQYRPQLGGTDNTALYVVGGGLLIGGGAAMALANRGSKAASPSP